MSGDYAKTVAISGAASGLGAALANYYASLGWHVAVTDQDKAGADRQLDVIRANGGDGFAMRLDVTSTTDWQQLKQIVLERWGGLGVLVNNAGVAAGGNVEETPLADWQWVLDIDLMGVVRGCHEFLGIFKQQGSGHIVNIASFAAMAGAADIAAYGTAKAGVYALSEAMRSDLHGTGVGVSVVCPAFFKTGLMDTFRSADPEADRARVGRWMEKSGITAELVSKEIYKAVESNRFLVLTHPETRWAWRIKRWLPGLYFRLLVKQSSSLSRRGEGVG
jgi:NAD(P)-dependent dehydrogenase (short-subunit alcohol dehydrogenase family)